MYIYTHIYIVHISYTFVTTAFCVESRAARGGLYIYICIYICIIHTLGLYTYGCIYIWYIFRMYIYYTYIVYHLFLSTLFCTLPLRAPRGGLALLYSLDVYTSKKKMSFDWFVLLCGLVLPLLHGSCTESIYMCWNVRVCLTHPEDTRAHTHTHTCTHAHIHTQCIDYTYTYVCIYIYVYAYIHSCKYL